MAGALAPPPAAELHNPLALRVPYVEPPEGARQRTIDTLYDFSFYVSLSILGISTTPYNYRNRGHNSSYTDTLNAEVWAQYAQIYAQAGDCGSEFFSSLYTPFDVEGGLQQPRVGPGRRLRS